MILLLILASNEVVLMIDREVGSELCNADLGPTFTFVSFA